MFEIFKPGLILFAISLVASLSLGLVNEITKEPIKQMEIQTENNARKELFPEADNFEAVEFEQSNSVTKIVEAEKGGEKLGYIMNAEPKGYGGKVSLVVAVASDNTIKGVKVLKHSETPGLGANAGKPEFIDQYKGLSEGIKVTKQKPADNEIQAITSATITSEAVTLGVNDCFDLIKSLK